MFKPEVGLIQRASDDSVLLFIIFIMSPISFVFQRNEYIFTLLEASKLQKMRVSNLEKERKMETKQNWDKKAKKDREKLILGLRLSKNCLHFLFRSNGGAVENCKFQSTSLHDNQWHTLILAIDNQRVSLTVDCGAPLEM